jgi:hypothetical protein
MEDLSVFSARPRLAAPLDQFAKVKDNAASAPRGILNTCWRFSGRRGVNLDSLPWGGEGWKWVGSRAIASG